MSGGGPSTSERGPSTAGGAPSTAGSGGGQAGEGGQAGRSITVEEPAGGLTAGLDPVVRDAGGTWIAWGDGEADFDVADERGCVDVPPDEGAYTLRRIDLPEEAVEGYYYGFSNRVLWPLCHEFPDLVEVRPGDLEWYRRVNERFAEAVADHADDGAVVWFQDYHFALAPRLVSESTPPSTTVAQFWHVPWPTPTTFRRCPDAADLLRGLLGNDLLGFHVDRYADHFLTCVDRFVPEATVDRERRVVRRAGETTRVVATPMGIDAEDYDRQARAVDPGDARATLESLGVSPENVIGLGLDRLDYSKGIPERLDALERFFERNPSWRGEFTFVQKATPSRTRIPTYERYGRLVREDVERINARFGTDDWQPIVYTEAYFDREDLCGLYRRADVMVVSPLLDGMNLVAQEYVASAVGGDGLLLLSDRAGAHDLLGSHAITIDPPDVEGVAESLERALSMPAAERRRRMQTLRTRVFDADLDRWMTTQFDWISRVHARDDATAAGTEPVRRRTGRAPVRGRPGRPAPGGAGDHSPRERSQPL